LAAITQLAKDKGKTGNKDSVSLWILLQLMGALPCDLWVFWGRKVKTDNFVS